LYVSRCTWQFWLIRGLQVFDFKVDREAESLLINGYALKLVPQRVRKVNLLAAVIPPNHPALSLSPSSLSGSVKSPQVIDALNKLDRNGLITADVDLFVMYEGDVRQLGIRIQVVEVEGKLVIHKDLLTAQVTLPQRPHRTQIGHSHPHIEQPSCVSADWRCRLTAWLKSLSPSCGGRAAGGRHSGFRHHGNGQYHHPGEYHRHRFHRPRHGFMRFIISVVIPVLIGAAAGVGIGILSVFIAEIVGGIIVRVRGRRNTGYLEIDRKEDDVTDEELPVYEELDETPEYTEEKQ
jgi:hypothetical protein